MGVTRPRAAVTSFIYISVRELCDGPYTNPNPKRDLDQAPPPAHTLEAAHQPTTALLKRCPTAYRPDAIT
jgi:hypothetical protein